MDLGIATSSKVPPTQVLPALAALPHRTRRLGLDLAAIANAGRLDGLLIDARADLAAARTLADTVRTAQVDVPTLAVLTAGGLVTLSAQWAISDFLVDTAPPAEVEARLLRAITGHRAKPGRPALGPSLDLDENTLSARIGDTTVTLTWTEFSLLSVLASQPGRVFPRSHLIARAWDGGRAPERTSINVHMSRIRRKLGPQAWRIRTVRSVGYQLTESDPPASELSRVS